SIISGDCFGVNRIIEHSDIPLFVEALLGTKPQAESLADMNAHGVADGLDTQPFLDYIFTLVCVRRHRLSGSRSFGSARAAKSTHPGPGAQTFSVKRAIGPTRIARKPHSYRRIQTQNTATKRLAAALRSALNMHPQGESNPCPILRKVLNPLHLPIPAMTTGVPTGG
ncbi:MAG: hypothetical protein O7F76_07540, partial [Planctomycetota bacterium]|nr:hypothetical protein [Planctomycetota bacterium]